MKDVTHELSQFERGLLTINSPHGIFRGGKMDGRTYLRKFSSETMRSEGSDEIYIRTGEIEKDKHGNFHVVYRLHNQKGARHD